jgi:hypothetical protein
MMRQQSDENDDAILILLQKHDGDLTEWEIDFLESIHESGPLSSKQQAKLNSIWERVVNGKYE